MCPPPVLAVYFVKCLCSWECSTKLGREIAVAAKTNPNPETNSKLADIIAKAKAESQQYWEEVSAKIDAYCEQHIGVRELLSIINSEKIQIKKS